MSRTLCTAILLAVTLLAGCKTQQAEPPPAARPAAATRSSPGARPALPTPPPAAPAQSVAAAMETPAETHARNMVAVQHLSSTLAADTADCEKLAVDLKAFIAENRPLVAMLTAAASWPSDDRQAGSDQAIVAAVAHKLHDAVATCASTSSVAAAMKDVSGT